MAQEVNLNSFQASEWEVILQVLHRDQEVQSVEEERIRTLKTHLQHLRWKDAKSGSPERREKTCSRCQRRLGLLLSRGAVCQGCSRRVCSECRVFLSGAHAWRCTVCYEGRSVRVKTGEWFFEERAKKFPTEVTGNSVRLKGFHKSVENLLLSVTTHMKKLSKSQNDMTSDKQLLHRSPTQGVGRTERRSQSDTAINATTRKTSAPDILQPLHQEGPQRPTHPVPKTDVSPCPTPSPLFSGGSRQGSLISIHSACTEVGSFDKADVTGEIEFALRYCFETLSLEICIKACKNLAYGEEKKKKCNPYVKTYLLPDRSSQGKRKTGVQKNTVDPTFQETLKYRVEPGQLVTRRLQVSVWHLGTLARRAFLGEVIVPLATWDFKDSATQSFRWHPLRAKAEKHEESLPSSHGELTVRAKLVLPAGPREGIGDEPSGQGQLCLVVLGAKDLPVRSDGTLNSFVKSCLTLPDKQKLRLRTPVLKKQACPQWQHSFVFNGVSPEQLRQSSLALTVWDQAPLGVGDRLLGEASLGSREEGLACSVGSGSQAKLQWQKVLASPNLWTDMTLVLH